MKDIQIPDAQGVPFSITPDRGSVRGYRSSRYPRSVACTVYLSPHFSLSVAGHEVSLKRLFRVGLIYGFCKKSLRKNETQTS